MDKDLFYSGYGNLSEQDAKELMELIDREREDAAWMSANEDFWRNNFPFDDFEDDELPW
jgi:hypothetical protein